MNFMRALQAAARWYFTSAGAVFNVFAMISFLGLMAGNGDLGWLPSMGAILDPLQNVATCTGALSGSKIGFETELPFMGLDSRGRKSEMVLLGQRSFIVGATKQGNRVIQTQARVKSDELAESQPLALEVNSGGEILRCLPSPLSAQARMTECLAAGGTYENQGDCLLSIQLPSDCTVMGGQREGEQTCRVPQNGRILGSAIQASKTK